MINFRGDFDLDDTQLEAIFHIARDHFRSEFKLEKFEKFKHEKLEKFKHEKFEKFKPEKFEKFKLEKFEKA